MDKVCVNPEVDRDGNVFNNTPASDADLQSIVLRGLYLTKNEYCNLHLTEDNFKNLVFCSKEIVDGEEL